MTRPLWLRAAPVIFLVLWSAGFGVAKLGLDHAPPMTLLALRYGILVLVLFGLGQYRGWSVFGASEAKSPPGATRSIYHK